MIPKIIHYCWFGKKEKGNDVKAYINNWHEKCPDYTFIEWNETSFNIESSCDYVKEAYGAGKWAFVTDYVRLYALYKYGGIYLDTDVEVLRPYDDLLYNKAFVCAESKYSICTATIGAEKESEFIRCIMALYENRKFRNNGVYDTTPNSQYIYKWLKEKFEYSYSKDISQNLGICTVYPAEYFSPVNCYTMVCEISNNTYSIHRYSGTWKSKWQKKKDRVLACITQIIGEERRELLKRCLRRKK